MINRNKLIPWSRLWWSCNRSQIWKCVVPTCLVLASTGHFIILLRHLYFGEKIQMPICMHIVVLEVFESMCSHWSLNSCIHKSYQGWRSKQEKNHYQIIKRNHTGLHEVWTNVQQQRKYALILSTRYFRHTYLNIMQKNQTIFCTKRYYFTIRAPANRCDALPWKIRNKIIVCNLFLTWEQTLSI
jgi:hypothetical protein